MGKNRKEKSFAVVFSYSFDDDTAVYLFHTEKEAKDFLVSSFENELKIDEENGWTVIPYIQHNKRYARITNAFQDEPSDITEFRLASVYQ